MVFWVIAVLLFLILIRLWPTVLRDVFRATGSFLSVAVLILLVVGALAGLIGGMYYFVRYIELAVDHPKAVPPFGWVLLSVCLALGIWRAITEERDEKRMLRTYREDPSVLTDDQRKQVERILDRQRKPAVRPVFVGLAVGLTVFLVWAALFRDEEERWLFVIGPLFSALTGGLVVYAEKTLRRKFPKRKGAVGATARPGSEEHL